MLTWFLNWCSNNSIAMRPIKGFNDVHVNISVGHDDVKMMSNNLGWKTSIIWIISEVHSMDSIVVSHWYNDHRQCKFTIVNLRFWPQTLVTFLTGSGAFRSSWIVFSYPPYQKLPPTPFPIAYTRCYVPEKTTCRTLNVS